MRTLFPRKSWVFLGFGCAYIPVGLLLWYAQDSLLLGIAFFVVGLTIAITGLILPSQFSDLAETSFCVLMPLLLLMIALPTNTEDMRIVLAFTALLSLITIISAVVQRKKIQQSLRAMWQLAEQHDCTTAQVKQLATFKRRIHRYSVADWELTRGGTPGFYPSQRSVRLVMSKLRHL